MRTQDIISHGGNTYYLYWQTALDGKTWCRVKVLDDRGSANDTPAISARKKPHGWTSSQRKNNPPDLSQRPNGQEEPQNNHEPGPRLLYHSGPQECNRRKTQWRK